MVQCPALREKRDMRVAVRGEAKLVRVRQAGAEKT